MSKVLMVAVLAGSLLVVGEARAATPFVDVAASHVFETEIDWMATEGITLGCNPPVNDRYCPEDVVTRGQMAAFLVRALGLTDDGGGDLFVDDDSSVFAGDIDRLGTAGITLGCNPPVNDRYCPEDVVTRGQMAAFLYRGIANQTKGPTIATLTLPDTIVGASYDTTLTATGGATPYTWSLASGSLPSGIDLSSTGGLTGNALASGIYSFAVSVVDAVGGSDTANFSITVVDADLEISTTALPIVVKDQPYDFQMEAIGGQPPYDWAVIGGLTLPPDLVLSSGGSITGIPQVGSGSGGITFQVTDANAAQATKVLTMTVITAPIEIDTSVPLPDGTTGESYEADTTLIGGIRPITQTVVAGDLPPGITMDTAGDFDGIPAVPGTFDFTVEVVDGAGTSDSADLSISVRPGPMTVNALVRVNVESDGSEADMSASNPDIAAGGRFVVFDTVAALIPADTNGVRDVYRHDLQTGTTEMVSFDLIGGTTTLPSQRPSVSANGRYVAFDSEAADHVLLDSNLTFDVFVRDMNTGTTQRVSVDSSGAEANGGSYFPSISDDGKRVAFASDADNLVTSDTNSSGDVFVHDIPSGTTRLVSVDSLGAQVTDDVITPTMSGDGSTVAYVTSADGVVPGDTNGWQDVYVVDVVTLDVERQTVDAAGNAANGASFHPTLSASGNTVAFHSYADNLVPGDANGQFDVYVRLRNSGEVLRASADGATESTQLAFAAAMAGGGRFVVFLVAGDELDPLDGNGHMDVYMYDIVDDRLRRISVRPEGTEGSGAAGPVAVSRNGDHVVFESLADNLVDDDTNASQDIFATRLIVPPSE